MNEQRLNPAGNDATISGASTSRRRVVTGLGALALGSAGFFVALQPAAASHDPHTNTNTNTNTNTHPSRRTRTRRSRHTDDRHYRQQQQRQRQRRRR